MGGWFLRSWKVVSGAVLPVILLWHCHDVLLSCGLKPRPMR